MAEVTETSSNTWLQPSLIVGLFLVLLACIAAIVIVPLYGGKVNPEITNYASTILGAIIGYLTSAVIKTVK
jgi:hypothetical protein